MLSSGWGMGGNWVSPSPAPSEKDFLSKLNGPFPRREPSTSHLRAGAAAFPMDIPTRPRNPCVTVPSPRRVPAYKGSLAPLSTYSTYTSSPEPGSAYTPFLQPQIFRILRAPKRAAEAACVISPHALVPAPTAKRSEAYFNGDQPHPNTQIPS